MARKLRLEYPGACYHVINRGNYRKWVFEEEGAAEAFERVMNEACQRNLWIMHAYVVMGNHYHIALETPEGNLASGMHWLQTTFATRFNRLRKENGHLFQGRYTSILIEPGEALGRVCHYIHLNPVRAGIVPVERLSEYAHSSYVLLAQKSKRPAHLKVETALLHAGNLADETEGWRAYEGYLQWQAAQGPAGRNAAYEKLSTGWAIGSPLFKEDLLRDYKKNVDLRTWDAVGVKEARSEMWEQKLKKYQSQLGESLPGAKKSDPIKIALATAMKLNSDVSNAWLARRLSMGEANYVGKLVCDLKRAKGGKAWELLQQLGHA